MKPDIKRRSNLYIYILTAIFCLCLSFASHAAGLTLYENSTFQYPTTRSLYKGKSYTSECLITGPEWWANYYEDWGQSPKDRVESNQTPGRNVYIPLDVYDKIEVGDWIEFNYSLEANPYEPYSYSDYSKGTFSFTISGALEGRYDGTYQNYKSSGTAKVYITKKKPSTTTSYRISGTTSSNDSTTVTGQRINVYFSASTNTSDTEGGYGFYMYVYGSKVGGVGYDITYNANGGSSTPAKQTQVSSVTLPSVSRTGYTFAGWYNGNTKVGNAGATYTPTENVTLTAHWTVNTYTITYNLNGGTNNSSNKTSYTIETATFSLYNPTRTGYTFEGWYTNAGLTNRVTSVAKGSTGNKVFYAKWKPITYNIRYVLYGGQVAVPLTYQYNIETPTFTLPVPTMSGFDFIGWSGNNAPNKDKAPNKTYQIQKGTYGDIIISANWHPKVSSFGKKMTEQTNIKSNRFTIA